MGFTPHSEDGPLATMINQCILLLATSYQEIASKSELLTKMSNQLEKFCGFMEFLTDQSMHRHTPKEFSRHLETAFSYGYLDLVSYPSRLGVLSQGIPQIDPRTDVDRTLFQIGLFGPYLGESTLPTYRNDRCQRTKDEICRSAKAFLYRGHKAAQNQLDSHRQKLLKRVTNSATQGIHRGTDITLPPLMNTFMVNYDLSRKTTQLQWGKVIRKRNSVGYSIREQLSSEFRNHPLQAKTLVDHLEKSILAQEYVVSVFRRICVAIDFDVWIAFATCWVLLDLDFHWQIYKFCARRNYKFDLKETETPLTKSIWYLSNYPSASHMESALDEHRRILDVFRRACQPPRNSIQVRADEFLVIPEHVDRSNTRLELRQRSA